MKTFFAVVGVILATVILGVAIWYAGWFVTEKNTDKQVEIDNRNKGTQTAWHDEAVSTIRDFELVPVDNTAARGALRDQACGLIARLTGPYRDDIIVSFEEVECS